MTDTRNAAVEVTVDYSGQTVWVNIGGVCAVRVKNPTVICIDDKREGRCMVEVESRLYGPFNSYDDGQKWCQERSIVHYRIRDIWLDEEE